MELKRFDCGCKVIVEMWTGRIALVNICKEHMHNKELQDHTDALGMALLKIIDLESKTEQEKKI